MAYYIIYSYNYVDNIYVIAWIISGILILSLQLTLPLWVSLGEQRKIRNKSMDSKRIRYG